MGNTIDHATALNDTITLSSAGQDTITLSSVPAPVYQTDTIDLSMLNNMATNMATNGTPCTVSTGVPGGFTAGTGWTTNTTPWFTQNTTSSKINLDGEGADIVVNGSSLVDAINSIRDRLNCLQINPELEKEWNDLRVLGDQYRELERQILEKQATWNRLKAMPAPDID
jgi:hypothetical protein